MVFSSLAFLFVFLPALLLCYFAVPKRYTAARKYVLMAFSLVFYACGEPLYIFVILGCILVTWLVSNGVARRSRLSFFIALAVNIVPLIICKYLDFIIENLNLLPFLDMPLVGIALPIGISFYTFQMLTYVIDLYRGQVRRQRNIGYLTLYIFLFPQLIAGPIVRYSDVEEAIGGSFENAEKVKEGVGRFIQGLAKKVLIANQAGYIVSTIQALDPAQVSTSLYWLAVAAYTVQIFFDFSGYSDMAIGLGRIFGFDFLENFRRPYHSLSVTEFWRRWHISMNTFFVDYIYIPLGGSRCSTRRWLFNILVVWSFTGLWHGAFWNYIVWGLYYAALLVIEKLWLSKLLKRIPKLFSWAYTFLMTMIGWSIFMNETNSLAEMASLTSRLFISAEAVNAPTVRALELQSYVPYVILGLLLSTPAVRAIDRLIEKLSSAKKPALGSAWSAVNDAARIAVFLLCVAYIVGGTYNPFIYFRF